MIISEELIEKIRYGSFFAISRSRAAELKAVKRLGGAERLSEASAFSKQRRGAEGQQRSGE